MAPDDAPASHPLQNTTSRGDGTAGVGGVLAGLFCVFTGVGLVLPVLPSFVRDVLGGSAPVIGGVMTASAVATVVARPIAGNLAERRGRRTIMTVGAATVAAAGMLYLLAGSVVALVTARLVLGVGEGFVFTAAALWIVSLATTDRRGQLVGFAGLAMWSGLTTGPLLGAWLLDEWGYRAAWVAAALLPAVGAVIVRWLPDPAATSAGAGGSLLPRAAVRPGLAMALGGCGYAALAAFLVLHLRGNGVTSGAVPFAAYGVGYVAARLLGGSLPDRVGPRRVILFGGFAEAAGLLVVAGAGTVITASVGALLTGASLSLLYPALALLVLDGTPPGQQGAALGAYTSFWDVGLGVAGPLLGGVVAVFDYPSAFLAAAALAVGSALVGSTIKIVDSGHGKGNGDA